MADPVNASIVTHFQSLEDPRIARTKKHNRLLPIGVLDMPDVIRSTRSA